ncbi:MAG: hypothetical protein R3D59_02680 [Paracoccaceae bacterium]
MTHATGPAGEVRLSAGSETGGRCRRVQLCHSFTLGEGETQRFSLPITAGAVGVHPVNVVLTTPDGTEPHQALTLPVERLDPEVARTSRLTLAAGESFR